MVWVWLVGAALFVAVEVFTLAFFALFVAVGVIGGAITAGLGAPVWAQVLVAAALAVGGVVVARPPLMHALRGRAPRGGLHWHSPIGQDAITVDRVGDNHHPGHVLYAGERWLAVTEAPDGLPPDTPVTILEIKGTTLVVWP